MLRIAKMVVMNDKDTRKGRDSAKNEVVSDLNFSSDSWKILHPFPPGSSCLDIIAFTTIAYPSRKCVDRIKTSSESVQDVQQSVILQRHAACQADQYHHSVSRQTH